MHKSSLSLQAKQDKHKWTPRSQVYFRKKNTKYTMDPGIYYSLEADEDNTIVTKNSLIRT